MAAFPTIHKVGSPTTLLTAKGAMTGSVGLVITSYSSTGTADANSYISSYPGAIILSTSDDTLYYRNAAANAWIPIISNSAVISLSAIGASPNANGATITGNVLNMQPASSSFGGVVTTSAQTLGAGVKTLIQDLVIQGELTTGGDPGISAGVGPSKDAGTGTTRFGVNTLTVALPTYTGYDNSAFGYWALKNVTSGYYCNGFGRQALEDLTTGSANNAFGWNSVSNLTTGTANSGFGHGTLRTLVTGSNNTALGSGVMFNIATTSSGNTGVGANCMVSATTGDYNTAGGNYALQNNQANGNTVWGFYGLNANTTGSSNTGVGYNVLLINTTGSNNTSVGSNSMAANVAANFCTAVGSGALATNNNHYNTAIGGNAMAANSSGDQCTATGYNALYRNTTGTKNCAFGAGAMENCTTGGFNVGLGQDSLLALTTGSGNIGIGWNGFANNAIGNNNIGIGYGAGKSITDGSNNVVLGREAGWVPGSQAVDVTNCIIIGYQAYSTASNQMILGNSSITQAIGFGAWRLPSYGSGARTGTATYTLQVDASGNIIEGSPASLGTVTSVSVVSANGFAGTVATATTTPAITLTTTVQTGRVLFANSNAISGVAGFTFDGTSAISLGQTGSSLASINMYGGTSGVVSIQPQAAAGTYNFNLPTTAGSSGQALLSGGGGGAAMTWSNVLVSANNALTANTSTNIQLGGPLIQDTAITAGAYQLGITGGTNAIYTFVVSNNQNGYSIYGVNTSGGFGVYGSGNSGYGVAGFCTSGIGGNFTSGTGVGLVGSVEPSSTNTTIEVARLDRKTSGTAAAGLGGTLDLYLERSDANASTVANQIKWVWTDPALATKTSNFIITGSNAGSVADLFTLSGAGALRLNAYGAGTATFDASGNITSVSDIRLKDVVGEFTLGIDAVKKINPINFKWKNDSGLDVKSVYSGFSAQNIEEALGGTAIGQNGQGHKSIQDRAIIAALVNGMKEQQAHIEQLQNELKQLQNKN